FYDLPERTRLEFFNNLTHFQRKLCEHFLDRREPWPTLLRAPVFDRLAQGSHREVDLMEAYRQTVETLDNGIGFAAKQPLYVRYRGTRVLQNGVRCTAEGFYFLAKEGYIV